MRRLASALGAAVILAAASMTPTPALADKDERVLFRCETKEGENVFEVSGPKKAAKEFAKQLERDLEEERGEKVKCKEVKD